MAKNYVCNGAKIECKLCTKPEGTLKVTSNEIKVQEIGMTGEHNYTGSIT